MIIHDKKKIKRINCLSIMSHSKVTMGISKQKVDGVFIRVPPKHFVHMKIMILKKHAVVQKI